VKLRLILIFKTPIEIKMGLLKNLFLYLTALLISSSSAFSQAKFLFVADAGANAIFRVNLDGSGVIYFLTNDFVPGLSGPEGVVVYEDINRIYWTEPANSRIGEATLQGNFIAYHNVQTPNANPTDIGINTLTNKIFWTESSPTFAIKRFNISNMAESTFLESNGQGGPQCIAVDSENNDIYYIDDLEGKIKKKNLQSTSTVFTGVANGPYYDLTINPANNRIYWIEAGNFDIKFANLDGTSSTSATLAPNIYKTPRGLALENTPQGSYLYWSNVDGTIKQFYLDAGVAPIVNTIASSNDGLSLPRGLALSKAPPLTDDTVILYPPQVAVDNTTNEVTLSFEDFSSPIVESSFGPMTALAASSLSTKYIATITNKTNNIIKKVVTKNTSATVKLPSGTYTAKYKALILSPVSASKKAQKKATLKEAIANLQKKPNTIANGNKIRAKKANLKLVGFKVEGTSSESPETEEFTVE
jgi:hypothetical protein